MNRTYPDYARLSDNHGLPDLPLLQSEDNQTIIEPPMSYRIGLLLFYGSIGLTFSNMSVLEEVILYRIIIATMSGIGFLLAYGARGPSYIDIKQYPRMTLMLNVWLIYVVYLTVVTMTRNGDVALSFYAGTVFYYMNLSMLLAYRHIQSGYNNKYFWQIIVLMAVVSTSVNFYFARFTSIKFDESEFAFIEDMRSQIISGSNMIIIAVGMIGITKSKNLALSYLLFFMIMFIYVISKTRNVMLGVALLMIYAVLVSDKRYTAVIQLFGGIAVALSIAYIVPLYYINYDIFDAWFGRLFTDADSISIDTFYTRLAEYKGQFNMLTANLQSGLFGFGYLETMIWDSGLWDLMFPDMDPTYYYATRYVGQHSTWINSLFQGGFIMGTIPTLSAAYVAWIGLKQILLPKEERAQLDIYSLFACGVVIYLLIPSSFGMLYGNRLATVSFGPVLIYAVYGWEKFNNSRAAAQLRNSTLSSGKPSDNFVAGQLASQHVRQG